MRNKIELAVGMSDAWWYDNYGVSIRVAQYYSDPEYRIRQDMERERLLYDRFGHLGMGNKDPIPSPSIANPGDVVAIMYGMEYDFRGRDGAWPVPMDLDDDAVFALRPIENVGETPFMQDLVRQMTYLEGKYGWRWTCTADWQGANFGVMNSALNFRGYQLLTDFAINPELARHLLSVTTQTNANCLDWQCEIWGRRPPFLGTGNCSDTMISPQTYLDFVFACDEWLAAKYQGIGIHRDDKLDPYLDAYLMHPKLVAADCGWDSDIAEVRKRLPAEKYHLNLRPDPFWFARATPSEIIAQIRRYIEDAGEPLSQFALVVDSMDASTPDSNIEALYEAVRA